MPTKRYGVSANLAPHRQYVMSSSAIPVLSQQKRYGLTAEIRQVIRTAYPLQTQFYSIRYGIEEQSVHATRRPRVRRMEEELPEVRVDRSQVIDVILTVPEEAEDSMLLQVEPLEVTEAEPTTPHPMKFEAYTEATVEGVYNDTILEGLETAAQITVHATVEHEVISSELNRKHDVIEDVTLLVERLAAIAEADAIIQVEHANVHIDQQEALLIEIDDMSPPYTEVLEHKLEQFKRLEQKMVVQEHRLEQSDMYLNPLSIEEDRPIEMTHIQEAEAQEIRPDEMSYFDEQPIVACITPDALTYQERIFNGVLMHPEEGQPVSGHMMHLELPEEGSSVYPDALLQVEETDLVRSTREDQVFLLQEELPTVGSMETVDDMLPLIESDVSTRLTEDKFLTLNALDVADGKGVVSPVELMDAAEAVTGLSPTPGVFLELIPSIRRVNDSIVRLEEVDDFVNSSFLVEEAKLDAAERIEIWCDSILDEMEWIEEPVKTVEVLEVIHEKATHVTLEDQVILQGLNEGTLSREWHLWMEQVERASNQTKSEVLLTHQQPGMKVTRFEVGLAEFDSGQGHREKDVILEAVDAVQGNRESDAVLEVLDEGTNERKHDVVLEELHPLDRRIRSDVIIEQSFGMTRNPVYMTELFEQETAGRTMKPLILTELELAEHKRMVQQVILEETQGADPYTKKKKKIWLIAAHGNHWNNWSGWKKTR